MKTCLFLSGCMSHVVLQVAVSFKLPLLGYSHTPHRDFLQKLDTSIIKSKQLTWIRVCCIVTWESLKKEKMIESLDLKRTLLSALTKEVDDLKNAIYDILFHMILPRINEYFWFAIFLYLFTTGILIPDPRNPEP